MKRARGRGWCGGDRGAVGSLELVLVAPVLLALLAFVMYCGRSGRASHTVRQLAAAAARAASIERTPGAATAAAADALAGASGGDVSCRKPAVSFGSSGTVETVTVRVRCDASMAGLSLLPIGGSRTFSASATEVIDRFREDA